MKVTYLTYHLHTGQNSSIFFRRKVFSRKKGDFCCSRTREVSSEGERLTWEKRLCTWVMEGIVVETQGNFYSPFLEGDQVRSPKKGDIRDFTLTEYNS